MMRIACSAMPSLIGLPRLLTFASIACVSASMPVAAVSPRGRPVVSIGSRIARRDELVVEDVDLATGAPGAWITAVLVTSLPVPAVVGSTTCGTGVPRSICSPRDRSRLPPAPRHTAVALAVSITLPPPTLTTTSTPCSRPSERRGIDGLEARVLRHVEEGRHVQRAERALHALDQAGRAPRPDR